MKVRVATAEDETAWDAYVLQHPDGLAYQLIAWRRAVKKAYGHTAHYLLAEKNNSICGVLPMVDFHLPLFGSSLISLPYCDAGGILADSDAIAQKLLDGALTMAKQSGAKCHIRSTIPLPFGCRNTTDKVRMLLELPDSSELFLASLKSKIRNKIKKPLRNGYRVATGSSELLEAFYTIFTANMHELGSPVHSRRWIEAIISEYQERVRIVVVFTSDEIPVAAGILLIHPTTVSNPWASSLREYKHMKPNMLLYATLLSFAADNGFKVFDFGRSTPGEGTYKFKQQWGAQPQSLYWYNWSSDGTVVALAQDEKLPVRFDKRKLVGNIWSHLPLGGANWLGPRIRKYISL